MPALAPFTTPLSPVGQVFTVFLVAAGSAAQPADRSRTHLSEAASPASSEAASLVAVASSACAGYRPRLAAVGGRPAEMQPAWRAREAPAFALPLPAALPAADGDARLAGQNATPWSPPRQEPKQPCTPGMPLVAREHALAEPARRGAAAVARALQPSWWLASKRPPRVAPSAVDAVACSLACGRPAGLLWPSVTSVDPRSQ